MKKTAFRCGFFWQLSLDIKVLNLYNDKSIIYAMCFEYIYIKVLNSIKLKFRTFGDFFDIIVVNCRLLF